MVLLEQDLYLGHGLSGHRTMTAAKATTKSRTLSTVLPVPELWSLVQLAKIHSSTKMDGSSESTDWLP